MKNFNGKLLFLDRKDINTDEIIPAKYLTEISKEALAPHLLEDLKLDGFSPEKDIEGKTVIISKENFGCGSSREHAPWALEMNNIYLVIADSFARIFRQNMYNGGMMAVELPKEKIEELFQKFNTADASVKTDGENKNFTFTAKGREMKIDFAVSDYDEALVESGGWIEYADKRY